MPRAALLYRLVIVSLRKLASVFERDACPITTCSSPPRCIANTRIFFRITTEFYRGGGGKGHFDVIFPRACSREHADVAHKFLTCRSIVFQDIDGDVGGAYARVSLHPAGPHREIAHPLNSGSASVGANRFIVVVSRRNAHAKKKRGGVARSARSCQREWRIVGLGPRTVFNQLANRHTKLANKKKREKKKKQDARQ